VVISVGTSQYVCSFMVQIRTRWPFEIMYLIEGNECTSVFRDLCSPGVDYTWNPSEYPEKDVDADLCQGHLSGRSHDVRRRGLAYQHRSRVLEEWCEREIGRMWGNLLIKTGMGGMNLIKMSTLALASERG